MRFTVRTVHRDIAVLCLSLGVRWLCMSATEVCYHFTESIVNSYIFPSKFSSVIPSFHSVGANGIRCVVSRCADNTATIMTWQTFWNAFCVLFWFLYSFSFFNFPKCPNGNYSIWNSKVSFFPSGIQLWTMNVSNRRNSNISLQCNSWPTASAVSWIALNFNLNEPLRRVFGEICQNGESTRIRCSSQPADRKAYLKFSNRQEIRRLSWFIPRHGSSNADPFR